MKRACPFLPSLSILAAGLLGGCGGANQLETGYRYQPLTSTSVERRAFYADSFSLEAMRAEAEAQQGGGGSGSAGTARQRRSQTIRNRQ